MLVPPRLAVPIAGLLCLLTGSGPASAAAAPARTTGRDLAEEMIYRDDGTSQYRLITLMTCPYTVNAGRYRCASQPVKKSIESLVLDDGPAHRDTVELGIIQAPADERGMAFQQRDYDQAGRDTDQWMYFPALRKLKRIVSESPNRPKTGSVFGSEFSYEDVERLQLDDHAWAIIGEDHLDTGDCVLLQATPTPRRLPRTAYGKQVFWVDRGSGVPYKRELYDKRTGELAKTIWLNQVERHGDAWIARKELAISYHSRRMSLVRIDRLAIDVPIDSALFERRALEDASYREERMRSLRQRAQ